MCPLAIDEAYITLNSNTGPIVSSVTINNNKPIVKGQNNNLVPIEFMGKADAGIKSVSFYVVNNGSEYLKETITPPTAKFKPWNISGTNPAVYQIKIQMKDNNGATGDKTVTVEVLDNSATNKPEVNISSPTRDMTYAKGAVNVKATAQDAAVMNMYITRPGSKEDSGLSEKVNGSILDKTFRADTSGQYTVRITAMNKLGKGGENSVTFLVGDPEPVIGAVTARNSGSSSNLELLIEGSGFTGKTAKVDTVTLNPVNSGGTIYSTKNSGDTKITVKSLSDTNIIASLPKGIKPGKYAVWIGKSQYSLNVKYNGYLEIEASEELKINSVMLFAKSIKPGDKLQIAVNTKGSPDSVTLQFDNLKNGWLEPITLNSSSLNNFNYERTINSPGKRKIRITAQKQGAEPAVYEDSFECTKDDAVQKNVQILASNITPRQGIPGSQFTFTVKASNNPDRVYLQFDNGRGGWLDKETCRNNLAMQVQSSSGNETTYTLTTVINTAGQPNSYQRKFKVWAQNKAGETYKDDYIVVKSNTSDIKVLKYGSIGDDVAVIQAYLWNGNPQEPYGQYGRATELAVAIWQEKYNSLHPKDQISTDGKVGKQTFGAMGFLNTQGDLNRNADPYLKYLKFARKNGEWSNTPDNPPGSNNNGATWDDKTLGSIIDMTRSSENLLFEQHMEKAIAKQELAQQLLKKAIKDNQFESSPALQQAMQKNNQKIGCLKSIVQVAKGVDITASGVFAAADNVEFWQKAARGEATIDDLGQTISSDGSLIAGLVEAPLGLPLLLGVSTYTLITNCFKLWDASLDLSTAFHDQLSYPVQYFMQQYRLASLAGLDDGLKGKRRDVDKFLFNLTIERHRLYDQVTTVETMIQKDAWWVPFQGKKELLNSIDQIQRCMLTEAVRDRQRQLYEENYNKGLAIQQAMIKASQLEKEAQDEVNKAFTSKKK